MVHLAPCNLALTLSFWHQQQSTQRPEVPLLSIAMLGATGVQNVAAKLSPVHVWSEGYLGQHLSRTSLARNVQP